MRVLMQDACALIPGLLPEAARAHVQMPLRMSFALIVRQHAVRRYGQSKIQNVLACCPHDLRAGRPRM
jgi:hypothetical protein